MISKIKNADKRLRSNPGPLSIWRGRCIARASRLSPISFAYRRPLESASRNDPATCGIQGVKKEGGDTFHAVLKYGSVV